jgi:hypothetical protein
LYIIRAKLEEKQENFFEAYSTYKYALKVWKEAQRQSPPVDNRSYENWGKKERKERKRKKKEITTTLSLSFSSLRILISIVE